MTLEQVIVYTKTKVALFKMQTIRNLYLLGLLSGEKTDELQKKNVMDFCEFAEKIKGDDDDLKAVREACK